MNGRIFFIAGVVINSAKTVWAKRGGGGRSRISEPRGPKSVGVVGPSGPIVVYAYARPPLYYYFLLLFLTFYSLVFIVICDLFSLPFILITTFTSLC